MKFKVLTAVLVLELLQWWAEMEAYPTFSWDNNIYSFWLICRWSHSWKKPHRMMRELIAVAMVIADRDHRCKKSCFADSLLISSVLNAKPMQVILACKLEEHSQDGHSNLISLHRNTKCIHCILCACRWAWSWQISRHWRVNQSMDAYLEEPDGALP